MLNTTKCCQPSCDGIDAELTMHESVSTQDENVTNIVYKGTGRDIVVLHFNLGKE